MTIAALDDATTQMVAVRRMHPVDPTPYVGLYTKAHELPWRLYGIIRTSLDEAPIFVGIGQSLALRAIIPWPFLPAR